jgi:type II secretory pathway component PulF
MLKIVPAFDKIFQDFDTELPAMTQSVITFSAWAFRLAPLWIMLNPLLTFLLIFGAIAYITLPTWDFQRIPYGTQSLWSLPRLISIFWLNLFFLPFRPLAMWLMKPYHRATIVDALARVVEGGRPLVPSLALLAQWYPQPAIRRRLTAAHDRAAAGVDWCDALARQRLIARGDAAVLRAAQRAGNLPWALRETAARGWRRVQTRTAVLNNVVLPLCVLAIAMGIAFLVIGLFLPLIKLIQTLA